MGKQAVCDFSLAKDTKSTAHHLTTANGRNRLEYPLHLEQMSGRPSLGAPQVWLAGP